MVLLSASRTAFSADDYSTWSNWRYVYLVTNASGANVTSTVTNFPVAIRLQHANFDGFGSTSNSGADIRFAKTDGTHLPYAIERWTYTATTKDTAVIWVLLDSVKASDTTKIIMYWNRAGAVDSSSSETVFNSSNGFRGTYHLSESSGTLYDASNMSFNGSRNGNVAQTAGRVGYGQSLDGTGDYVDMGNYMNPWSGNFTLSTWIKRGSTGSSQTIMAKSNGGAPSSAYGWLLMFDPGNSMHFFAASGGTNWGDAGTFNFVSSGTISDLTTWHHVVCVVDQSSSTNCKIYIDGANATGSTYGNITTVGDIVNSVAARIGSESDGEVQLTSYVDEARIEFTTRSAAWVKLCYQNQTWNGTKDNFTRFSPSYTQSPRYTWDNSTGAGYTAHSNTWNTSSAYWSQTGLSLAAWPGSGNTAQFAGSAGNWAVTVSGTPYVDSIDFLTTGYRVSGGTLNLAKKLSGAVFGFSPPWGGNIDNDSAQAFDGNTSTSCDDGNASGGYVGIDIGAGRAERISYIRFYPRSGTGNPSRMSGGKFQGSNDASSWTDLHTITSDTSLDWHTAAVTNTTAWRYLRYSCPNNSYCNVAEIEFYGMGAVSVASGMYDTIATVIAGNSGIRKSGAGYLTFSGTNTYKGPTEINSGVLQVLTLANGGSSSTIGASANTAENLVLNGGILRYAGGTLSCDRLFTLGASGGGVWASGSGALTLSNSGSVAFTGSGARTLELGGSFAGTNVFASVVGNGSGGATSLNKTSATCTWALTGTNTYTGTTTISEGILQIGNGSTTGAIANASTVANSGTLTFNRSNDYPYTGVISGAGAIIKEGAGKVTLSGNLTHSGVTTINNGTLRLTGTQTSTARKHVINAGGTLSVPGRLSVGAYPGSYVADWVTINGGTLSAAIENGSSFGVNSGFTLGASGGTIAIPYTDNTNPVEIASVVAGSGALTKSGVGVLVLSGTNTFSGGVVVGGGVLRTANTAALGNSSNTITVNSGGCIDVNRYNLQAYTNNITINGQVSSDTGALVNFGAEQLDAFRKIALGSNASIGQNGGGRFDIGRNYTGATCITGNSHTLTKIGTNSVFLLAIGSGMSSVMVNGGTLGLENANAVGTAPLTINSGGQISFWNNLTFTNNLTLNGGTLASSPGNAYSTVWAGPVAVASASTLACQADNTITLSGAVTGAGSLTVTGNEGEVVLSGNSNTYAGGTTVSGATLRITNSSGSATGTGAVSVAAGAILSGTGRVSGAVTVSGTLSPGNGGTGVLTVGNNLTFTGSGVYSVAVNGTTAGTNYDKVVMSSGTLALGSATLSLSLGYTPTIGDAYTIIDNKGAGAVAGTFAGILQGGKTVVSYAGTGYDCSVSYVGGDGNDVVVTVTRVSSEVYETDWGYSQAILLNTTPTGANVTGNVLNFPVLLRLNPGNFSGFSNTQPGGVDIRFAKTNGEKLKYQIERWKDYDSDADTAEVWVKLDTVYGNNKTQSFVMYWGKSDAADSSSGAAVFDTANGFTGVWHLGETGNSTADGYADASYNAAHGQGSNLSSGSEIPAVIGRGQKLVNASSQYVTIKAGAEPKFDITSAITVSGWINVTSWAEVWQAIVTKGDGAWRLHRSAGNGYLNFSCTGLTPWSIEGSTTLSVGTDTWYYVTGVYDGSKLYLYLNGKSDAVALAVTGSITTNNNNVMFGENEFSPERYFDGSMDEVRIEKTARNAHWVKLCYENQKNTQTLVSFEDYTTWGFSRNITINTTGITTTSCLNFPLLVRLTGANFDFNQAQSNGEDIRFAKSNGAKLAYQVERWDKAGAAAEIWVRVDTIYGSNASQYMKMYWGKGGVASKSSGSEVFDTTNGFVGVWHLNESSGSAADATGNSYTASRNGGVAQYSGGIGYGQTFDGSGDYFKTGAFDKVNFGGIYTVSAWVYLSSSVASPGALLSKGNDNATWEAQETQFFLGNNTTNPAQQGRYPQFVGHSRAYILGGTAIGTNDWHFATFVYNNTGPVKQVYIDGQALTPSLTDYIGGTDNAGNLFFIGRKVADECNNDFNGRMDEVVVAKALRSADWINLCYETQKPTPTIMTTDSADAFRPLGIRRYGLSSAPDSIYVGTNRWALRFAKGKGGGIKFLAADTAGATANQLDKNLFYLVYNGVHSSDTGTGVLTLVDSSIVFARLRQQKSVAGQIFTLDYTVLGNGKLYVRVSAGATAALSGGLEFRVANNATVSYTNVAFGLVPATCNGVAHIDNGPGKFDIIMAPYDNWVSADQITTNSKYTGLLSSSWSAPVGAAFSWEFMVDFSHRTLTDSATAYRYAADYRNSDTLGFYAGTPLLEQAWESEEKGEWAFDEGTGSTVADKSGQGHTAAVSGTPTWTAGKWYSSATSLGGTDSVTVASHADFDGGNALTITAWIKPYTLLSSSVAIFKKYSSADVGYAFTGGPAGTLEYKMANGGSTVALQSSTVLTPGVWWHVAVQKFELGKQDFLALFINGILDTVRIVELNAYYGSSPSAVIIGKNFSGVIDDVRFFNKLLANDEIRAIALKGFSPDRGMYRVRADNNNTLHCRMHGHPTPHFLPVLQITNYWATGLPTYVYVDGVLLTSGIDYYAALDDNRNQLTIGLNRVVTGNTAIFIDDNVTNGSRRTGPTKKMYWGITGASNQYFWVKNTAGRYFDAASSNQFYLNWKMNRASNKDGEIWHMRSSVTNPYTYIDTLTGTNLIPGDGNYQNSMGEININIGGNLAHTTISVSNSFTYAVEESSLVRVRLRVNERQVTNTSSFNIVTRWTIYPTGQIYRYDSLYGMSAAPTAVYLSWFMADQTNASSSVNKFKKRGLVNYSSQTYPDLVAAVLSMKNSSANQAYPFDADTVATLKEATRVGFDFGQWSSLPAKWDGSGTKSVQVVSCADFHHAAMNAASMDSIANGVQCSRFANRRALSMITGTLDSTTEGDFSDGIISGIGGDNGGDGFNEMEGAYIIGASNNTVKFVLPAHGDTCRYYPVFRITGYTAVNRPEYVYVYQGKTQGDSIALLEGYQFNSYVNRSTHELLLQLDTIFCDSVGIYISSDKTLAVKMSSFEARSGNRCDSLLWRTESEQANLGYRIERRIQPAFFDSVYASFSRQDTGRQNASTGDDASLLVKQRQISAMDTGWVVITKTLVPGAPSGASYGPRDYCYVDRNLFNGVLYEYRLVAVDYSRSEETHGPVAAMPKRIVPARFMLGNNYPNPFRYSTQILFTLPVESAVSLNIYTLQGRLVRRLVRPDRKLIADYHTVLWDGRGENGVQCAAGPYIYRLTTARFMKSRIMLIVR